MCVISKAFPVINEILDVGRCMRFSEFKHSSINVDYTTHYFLYVFVKYILKRKGDMCNK